MTTGISAAFPYCILPSKFLHIRTREDKSADNKSTNNATQHWNNVHLFKTLCCCVYFTSCLVDYKIEELPEDKEIF